MIIKLIRYLKNINSLSFIFIGVASVISLAAIFSLITKCSQGINPLLFKNKYYAFFIAVIFDPLIETTIFQAIPFYFVNRYIKHRKKLWILLFITPILFIHTFSLGYILYTYFAGCILVFLYYIAYYRKEKAVILISIIHMIFNLIVYSVYYLS